MTINILMFILIALIIIRQVNEVRQISLKAIRLKSIYIILGLAMLIIGGVVYFYANEPIYYVIGIECILLLISLSVQEGISKKGFLVISKGASLVKWQKISEVKIYIEKELKVIVIGTGSVAKLYFKKNDYDKLINELKNNLPIKSKWEVIK